MSLKLAVLFCVVALASAVPQRPFLTHASKKRLDIPRPQSPQPDPSNVTRWFTSQLLDHFESLQFGANVTQQFELGPQNKWVAWGGSYPGMMAAFIRLKYANALTQDAALSFFGT